VAVSFERDIRRLRKRACTQGREGGEFERGISAKLRIRFTSLRGASEERKKVQFNTLEGGGGSLWRVAKGQSIL